MANSMGNIFKQNNFIANSFDVSTNSQQNFNRLNQTIGQTIPVMI